MHLKQGYSLFDTAFWGNPTTKAHARVRVFFLIILFLLGVFYWIIFFSSGRLHLNWHDWGKEDTYLNTLRLAQVDRVIPWLWNKPFYQGTDLFLANPEVTLGPDIFLLRWVANGTFVMLHTILFYAVGFWASYLLARKLELAFVSFCFFWLVFNFNGYLTSHLAMGHFQWTGYFLIPFFFYLLFRLADRDLDGSFDKRSVFLMSLLLGILFLNGSFHIALWCSMFLLVVAILKRTMLLQCLAAVTLGLLLGTCRLLPAALWFPEKTSPIRQGYPTLSSLLDAFTTFRLYDFAGLLDQETKMWRWWEYSYFIGFTAFAVLLVALIFSLRRHELFHRPYLFQAAMIFLVLSMGNVYNIINVLPLPVIGFERVPSRLIVLPFTLLLITSLKGIDEAIRAGGGPAKVIGAGALFFAAGELAIQLKYWRIISFERLLSDLTKPVIALVPTSDQVYVLGVSAGWIVSLITLIVIFLLFYRKTPAARH